MKVLWFTNTPGLYKQEAKSNGGGWISSLEAELIKSSTIQLGISFISEISLFRDQKDGVTYYPILNYENKIQKVVNQFKFNSNEKFIIHQMKKIINDFQPDLIHIFGSEKEFGLIISQTSIPVVIHIQGLLTPCINAWFPPNYSFIDLWSMHISNLLNIYKSISSYKRNKFMAQRERYILANCQHVMGRTEWDYKLSRLLASSSTYHYCGEVLRPTFYEKVQSSKLKKQKNISLMTTISNPMYKGGDQVLKIAQLLTHKDISYEWHIYGISSLKLAEKKTGIKCKSLKIFFHEIATAEELKERMLQSDIFIHPSYIDNSPNSVCEAQIMGIPVVACNVGGISSLIRHKKTGFIFPANDPYMAASHIIQLKENKQLYQQISKNGQTEAFKRHDKVTILNNLMQIYKYILSCNK